MKILLIQEASADKKDYQFRECISLRRAFEYHNHVAHVWGLGHDNFKEIPNWNNYDFIINLENYDLINWIPNLSHVKVTKCLWVIDAHCKGIHHYLKTFNEGNYDFILQATPEFLNEKSVWMPNAYDDDIIKPLSIEKKYDIGFCGHLNNRGVLIDILQANFDFKLDKGVRGDNMVEAINKYRIHFNANISIDINYRHFETIGCGTCLLTSYNKHLSTLGFKDGENCIIYRNAVEMVQKVKHILENPNELNRISTNGLILAKDHTYKKRVSIIEQAYNTIRKKI
jgi:hypothetical protein